MPNSRKQSKELVDGEEKKRKVPQIFERKLPSVHDMWSNAVDYMPISTLSKTPMCVPNAVALSEDSMRIMFDAFDTDFSGSLDRDEVGQVLRNAGVAEEEIQESLNEMFKVDQIARDGLPWEIFKLWLRREGFAERNLTRFEQVFQTLDEPSSSQVAMYIGLAVVVLILGSVVSFMCESLPWFKSQVHCMEKTGTEFCTPRVNSPALEMFEMFVIAIFSLEYVVRFICCPFIHVADLSMTYDAVSTYLSFSFAKASTVDQKKMFQDSVNLSKGSKIWLFIKKPMNVVDLLAIAPFYIELFFTSEEGGAGFAALRILRLCRLLRVFKLSKYNSAFGIFFSTVVKSAPALSVLLFIMALVITLFGAILFLAEEGTYYPPDGDCGDGPGSCAQYGDTGVFMRETPYGVLDPSPFGSIFDAAWCVLTTMTTVGYGDSYPVTLAGRLITALVMIVGLMSIAMPITVLGSNFQEEYEAHTNSENQRKKDIFVAITIGLTEYQKVVQEEHDRSQRQEERVLLRLIETEMSKVDNAAQKLRDEGQARLELEHNAADNNQSLEKLKSDVAEMKHSINLLLGASGIAAPKRKSVAKVDFTSVTKEINCFLPKELTITPSCDEGKQQAILPTPAARVSPDAVEPIIITDDANEPIIITDDANEPIMTITDSKIFI